jgi:ABC-type polysaccharide/polyol phosphate transport system ATPase subunit
VSPSTGSGQARSTGARPAAAIELANVSKIYRRYGARHFATLKSALMQRSILEDLKPGETFQALTDVSMRVPAGCTMGLVGRNGSGKSTALKLVAGITKPTNGSVTVRGRISALIELGAGFHPEISGRENVFINGIMLGLTKREIERRFDEIVEFAELKDFIDEPVKSYSSGMYMRLGFAVATHVDPDVLLVDEVLAVGDEGFTHKCLDKFGDFKRRGKTILLVTHSLNLVERFCDEAVWLDAGRKRVEGDPKRVIDAYISDVEREEEKFLAASDQKAHDVVEAPPVTTAPAPAPPPTVDDPTSDMMKASEGRWGSRQVEILDVALLDRAGQPAHIFQSGDPLIVRLAIRAEQPVDDCVFGVALFNAEGTCVYGTNTEIDSIEPQSVTGDAQITVSFQALELVEGTYKVDVAAHKRDGVPYDYHRLLHTFRIKSRTQDVGIYRPRHEWTFDGGVRATPKR